MAKKIANENTVETTERALRELQKKQAELVEACKNDEAAMAAESYEAYTGNEKAAARLETLRDRALRRDVEAKNLASATAEAERRLAAAKADEAAAEVKANAKQAAVALERIEELYASADKNFAQAFAAIVAADKRITELHMLGYERPTAVQVRVNIRYAVDTLLAQMPQYIWDELSRGGVRYPSPAQRRTFSQFWNTMSDVLSREIADNLGEKSEEKVA